MLPLGIEISVEISSPPPVSHLRGLAVFRREAISSNLRSVRRHCCDRAATGDGLGQPHEGRCTKFPPDGIL